MQTFLAFLSALLVGALETYLQQRGARLAIEEKVRLEEALKGYRLAQRALEWKASAVADRDVSDDLGVREPASRILVPGDDAGVAGPSGDPPVPGHES